MEIRVNGKPRTLAAATTLAELLEELGIAPERLAIEHNGDLLPTETDRGELVLREGDVLEILRFVGGG